MPHYTVRACSRSLFHNSERIPLPGTHTAPARHRRTDVHCRNVHTHKRTYTHTRALSTTTTTTTTTTSTIRHRPPRRYGITYKNMPGALLFTARCAPSIHTTTGTFTFPLATPYRSPTCSSTMRKFAFGGGAGDSTKNSPVQVLDYSDASLNVLSL